MQRAATAEEVDQEIVRLRLKVVEVCRRAGIAPTTFYRWRNGSSDLTLTRYNLLVAAIQDMGSIPAPKAA